MFLLAGVLAGSFGYFSAPKAQAATVECPQSGNCYPNDQVTISNFPGTVTLGKDFTFQVNVKSVDFDATKPNGDPINNLSTWRGANIYICPQSMGSCSHTNNDLTTVTVSDATTTMSGGTGSFNVTADISSKLEWAQNLPQNLKLLVEVDLRGFDVSGNFAEDFTSDTTQTVSTQLVAAAAGDKTVNFDIINTSGTFSSGVESFKVVGSVGGVINPPGYTWHWFISENSGPMVAFKDISALSSLDNHSEFTFPDGYLNPKSNYSIQVEVVDTSVTPNATSKAGPKPLLISSSVNNSDANSGVNPNCTGFGSGLICFVESLFVTLVNIVRGIMIAIVTLIIAPTLQAVLSIQPHDPSFSAVVNPVWTIIRNLMYIYYILIFLLMGAAEILGLEAYNFKHAAFPTILSIMGISFSKPLFQGVASIFDTFQAQFMPNNGDVIGKLAAQLIGDPFSTQTASVWQLTGTFSGIASSVFGLIFAFAALVLLGAVVAFMMVRIVTLWAGVGLSPFALGGLGSHLTEHEAKKSLMATFKAFAYGPAVGAGLSICAAISDSVRTYLQSHGADALTAPGATGATGTLLPAGGAISNANFAAFIANILANVLVLGCLFATLEIAKEFGMFGASTIAGYAEKGFHGGLHSAGNYFQKKKYNATADWARGGFLKRAGFRLLNPGLSGKAFMEASHHELEEAKSKAMGAASYLEEKRRGHGLDNRADVNAQRKIEASREAQFADNSDDQNFEGMMNEMHTPGHTSDKIGRLRVMMANGQFKKNASKAIKDMKIGNGEFNADNVGALLRTYLGDSEQAKRFMAVDMTKRAKDAGMMEAGNAYVVGANGKYIRGDEQMDVKDASDDVKKFLMNTPGITMKETDKISAQKHAMLNMINSVDLEKRGDIQLNPDSYFQQGTDKIKPEDLAMVRMVTAGGAEAARSMSSSQRGRYGLTKKIDKVNGTMWYDNELAVKRLKALYMDDPQSTEFITTLAAKNLGVNERKFQNFNGVPVGYGDIDAPTQAVITAGGLTTNELKNGTRTVTYAATGPAGRTVPIGIRPDQSMTPTGQRATAGAPNPPGGGGGGAGGGGGRRQAGFTTTAAGREYREPSRPEPDRPYTGPTR